MIHRKDLDTAISLVKKYLLESKICVSQLEIETMDVADFGLDNYEVEGAQMITFFCTERVSTKLLVMFPNQTLPEHWHTGFNNDLGKEETLRVASGTLYMYVNGNNNIKYGSVPKKNKEHYTCLHEIVMKPSDQITFVPGEKHWFQAGDEGAIVYSFSSSAKDALDPFTNPNIIRVTKIVD